MHIVALEATNVKRLKAVRIVPNGALTQISGRNGAGKSSALDSILYAVAGKKFIPSQPVRRGETFAVIKLDLGDVKVIRKFSANGNTEVVLEAESGARFPSPQRMLDEIFGDLTFDPVKFATSEPKAQLEILRGLVKLDVDVDELDRLNEKDYTLRTDWNRRAKTFEERVNTLRDGIDESIDVTPVDMSALTSEVEKAQQHNRDVETEERMRFDLARRIEDLKSLITGRRQLIEQKEQELAKLRQSLGQDEQQLGERRSEQSRLGDVPKRIDVREVTVKIQEAEKENARREIQRRARGALEAAEQQLREAETQSHDLSDRIKTRQEVKANAIADAKMPIDGLAFGDGMVLFNDLPLDQASTAEQIRVSFAVAMAMNPKLKVVLIRDGNALDEDSVAMIAEMAELHDYQVLMEVVKKDSPVGVVIEDGEVIAIDGVPVKAAETAAD